MFNLKQYSNKPYIIQYKIHKMKTGYFGLIELRYFNDKGKLKLVPVMLDIFEKEELVILELKRLKSIYLFFNGNTFNDPKLALLISNYDE